MRNFESVVCTPRVNREMTHTSKSHVNKTRHGRHTVLYRDNGCPRVDECHITRKSHAESFVYTSFMCDLTQACFSHVVSFVYMSHVTWRAIHTPSLLCTRQVFNAHKRWLFMYTTRASKTKSSRTVTATIQRDTSRSTLRKYHGRHLALYYQYGVATISRLLKTIGLFCRMSSLL